MIDLGYKTVDYDKIHMAKPGPITDKERPMKTAFPEFCIHKAPPELSEIPEDGEAVIKFHVTSKESRETMEGGEKKKSLRIELEVREIKIKGMKSGEAAKEMKSMGDADSAVADFFKSDPENGEQPDE